MSRIALAVKYRPQTMEDVTEQGATLQILKKQLTNGTFKNTYLFCGPAGCGKTTIARILAKDINKGQGQPIEIDAASNNSVENIRQIITDSQQRSFAGEYKVYILDECHALSNNAWQAMLKLIEEPPAKTIFIFCTTDPQKIPATIISRVQRFDFQRISFDGVVNRLVYILNQEKQFPENIELNWESDAINFIAKVCDGGMRDGITMMDKAISYSTNLTLSNVVKALGTVNYDTMFELTNSVIDQKQEDVMKIINTIYSEGTDLKQFMKDYSLFLLDLIRYMKTKSFQFVKIPELYKDKMEATILDTNTFLYRLLRRVIKLNDTVKWEHKSRDIIEMELILACVED